MWWFVLTFVIGLAVGRKRLLPAALLQRPSLLVTPSLCLLLLFLGIQIGKQPAILDNLLQLGGQALVIAACTMVGSALTVALAYRLLRRPGSGGRQEGGGDA